MFRSIRASCAAAVLAALPAGLATADTVCGDLVLRFGDEVDGATVIALSFPTMNDDGVVGFGGVLSDGRRFMWYDDTSVWIGNIDEGHQGVIGEFAGAGNEGQRIFDSAPFGLPECLVSNDEILVCSGSPLPCIEGQPNFFRFPTMRGDGASYFYTRTTQEEHVIFRLAPGTGTGCDGTDYSVMLQNATVVHGVNDRYDVSDDGRYFACSAHALVPFDPAIYLAYFDDPNGSVTTEMIEILASQYLENLAINDSGRFLMSGSLPVEGQPGEHLSLHVGQFDTAPAAVATDVAVISGDVLDGVTISGHPGEAVAINNLDQVLFAAKNDLAGVQHTLFFAEADDIAGTAQVVLHPEDTLVSPQGTLENIAPAVRSSSGGPNVATLDLSDHPWTYVKVLVDGSHVDTAIIRVDLPAQRCTWDLDGDGQVAVNDLVTLILEWGDPYDVEDLVNMILAWGPCC